MVDSNRVKAISFDSFTTLVDVQASTASALESHLDDPLPVVKLWRHRAIEYRMVSTFTDKYESYEETTREALEYSLAAHGINLNEEIVDEIAGVFFDLNVYDDVTESMRTLRAEGYELSIVSNGTPRLLNQIKHDAGISNLIKNTISAHEIQTYKPAAEFYEHAADRMQTAIDDILHVTAPWYDVYGAMAAGMQAVWVNRSDRPWEAFDGTPDASVGSLKNIPDLL